MNGGGNRSDSEGPVTGNPGYHDRGHQGGGHHGGGHSGGGELGELHKKLLKKMTGGDSDDGSDDSSEGPTCGHP